MNKLFLVALVSTLSIASSMPSFAAPAKTTSSDSKMAKAGKAMKEGALWAPRKIGAGMKAMGEKTKKAFHHGK
jgi:hypothetical protein